MPLTAFPLPHLEEWERQLFVEQTQDNIVSDRTFQFLWLIEDRVFFFYFLVWVDTGSGCHTVNIRIGSGVSDTRQWRIKVTQYDCGIEEVTGPPGCLQYLTADSGTIQSFNFPTSETVPTSCK